MELEDLISDAVLDDYLQKPTNFETFNRLLEIKKKRLLEGKTEKIRIPLKEICDSSATIEQKCKILKNALVITDNSNYKTLIENLIKHIDFGDITNENIVMDTIKILNVFLEFSLTENREIQQNFDKFADIIDQILKFFSKQSTNFIVTQFLPNYLQLETVNDCFILWQLSRSLKETNRIEILFYLIDTCILPRNDYRLFQMLDIWEILQESLVTDDYYQQKQTKYLLRKIVDLFFDKPQIKLPLFSDDIVRKSWRNFFIVLDASNEKQLHLIQPSLNLLETLKYLHYKWQICLYRVLLKHKQNSIVYYTATLILQQEDFVLFQEICIDLFNAINLNEYSQISSKFFRELSKFCKASSDGEIAEILRESLKISWNPTTIWCFYSSVFNGETVIRIGVDLIESLLEKIKKLPDVFIRNRLIELILRYFIGNFVPHSGDNLLKFFTIVDKFRVDLFDEGLVKFERNLRCFEADIKKSLSNNNLVVVKILQKLDRNYLMEKLENSDRKFNLFYDNYKNNLETYIENRLGSCQDAESIDHLLDLVRRYENAALFNRALDILENHDTGVNQELIAFEILNTNWDHSNSCDRILRIYQTKIWKTPKLVAPYLDLLLKNCANPADFEENLDTFYKILELQIDENFAVFIKHLKKIQQFSKDSKPIQNFIDGFFKGILTIDNHQFRTIITILIDDLVSVEVINAKILEFIKILVGLPNLRAIIAVLMGKLSTITREKPQLFRNHFSIFLDMVLYGKIVNKTEKIEYCVYQDVSLKLNLDKLNPNLDHLSIRLHAIDSLLNLLKFNGDIVDDIVGSLLKKYAENSKKRYFPNSQIHLEKQRIVQVFVLIERFLTENSSNKLIDFVIDSFLNESHQLSVKYLMQLLLTNLLANKRNSIEIIAENLQRANYKRPTCVSAFIPVLYNLILKRDDKWDRIVEILLNYSMGPQFRLRLLSQIALLKLYNSAKRRNYGEFVEKYKYLYQSVKTVVDSSSDDFEEFLENFNVTPTTVLYDIPKLAKVIPIEWENLPIIAENYKFDITFNNEIFKDEIIQFSIDTYEISTDNLPVDNIQKKITPWRDILIDNPSDFILVTTLIEKPSNLGGLSRTCEIFRIKQFVLNTINILRDNEFKNLSMSSENWLKFMEIKLNDLQQFLIDIKTKGYCCVGAEQTCDSRKLQQFQFPKLTVLVLGNEREGIPPNLIPHLDYCVEIPQFGVVRSLNVHVAGAIFLWEYCKQHLLEI